MESLHPPRAPRAMALAVMAIVCAAASTASGCMAYEPSAEFAVKDPKLVEVRAMSGKAIENHTVSGALVVGSRTVVDADGDMNGVGSLEDLHFGEGTVSLPVCTAWHRRRACDRVRVTTPRSNVRALSSADEPIRFIGAVELLLGAGMITGGAIASEGQDHQTSSGGPIVITSGVVVTIVGLLQLFGPAKNEQALVP